MAQLYEEYCKLRWRTAGCNGTDGACAAEAEVALRLQYLSS